MSPRATERALGRAPAVRNRSTQRSRSGQRGAAGSAGASTAAPVNLSPPTLDQDPSTVLDGGAIQFTPGTWSGAPALTYEVYRDGVQIPGADETYVYTSADIEGTPEITLLEIPNGDSGAGVESNGRSWSPETPGDLRGWLEDAFVLSDSDTLVQTWLDLSAASDCDVTQGTTASRPAYTATDADFGGRPSLTPDGVNDMMLSTLAASAWRFLHDGTGMTVAAATKTRTVPALGALFSTGDTSIATGLSIFQQAATDVWRFFLKNGTGTVVDNTAPADSADDNTRYDVVMGHATAANPVQYFRSNGVEIDTQVSNTNAPNAGDPLGTLRLFAIQAGSGSFATTKIACLLFYDADKRAHAADLESYMTGRFG